MEEKLKIVTDILGSSRRVGNEFLFHCPYCKHHKKKMSLNFGVNAFKCWVCDTRGKNIYRLIRRWGTYNQRQKWLELDGRLDLSDFDKLFMEINNEEEVQTVDLPDEFVSLCNRHLPRSSKRAKDYLYRRGLTDKDIFYWKIGYCPEGQYGGRVVIPSFNDRGDCNYFVARSYVGHKRKYMNPKVSKDIIFNQLTVDWDESLILVEGVFDAIVGGHNTIPILGSTLRVDSKLFQAIALNDTPVYLALDADAEKKARRIVSSMLEYDIELYKIDVQGCEDVGSMSKEVFTNRLNNAAPIEYDTYFLMDQIRRINV